MEQHHPTRFRVTGKRHSITVVAQVFDTLAEANALARRMASIPNTEVEVAEVPDPTECDLTTLTRERSEAIGWRRDPSKTADHVSVTAGSEGT